jgi:hypothetical protein
LRKRLLRSSRQSCTIILPSEPPSSLIILMRRSNAPSKTTIFCISYTYRRNIAYA